MPIELIDIQDVKTELNLSDLRQIYQFYTVQTDRDGNFKDISINYKLFIEKLKSFGFRRFDITEDKENTILIKIENNIIQKVSKNFIQDTFFEYINTIPEKLFRADGFSKDYLLNKLYKSVSLYFSDDKFSLLTSDEKIELNTDTENEAFFYFLNSFIKVTKENITSLNYNLLEKKIWKNQIIQHDFKIKKVNPEHPFVNFCIDISNNDSQRFDALRSIIGYCLHKYKNVKDQAIILTDGRLSDEAAGRTGKGLLMQAIGKCLNANSTDKCFVVIPGKYFDFANKHRYQDCELNTVLVHLDDIKKNFSFENLFNDIDTGIQVDKKNEKPFNIPVKIVLSTNKAIKIEGPSAIARSYEFELADYYNENFTPIDKYGHRFFYDWNKEQWNDFYNFMLDCVRFYLANGLIRARTLVLEEKKLYEQTAPEFIEWCRSEDTFGVKNIQFYVEYSKKDLYQKFVSQYPDFSKLKQNTFTAWLKLYALLNQQPRFKPFRQEYKPVMERTAGGVSYIKFLPLDYEFSNDELKILKNA